MSLRLKEIMLQQAQFDRDHQGAIPFFERIGEDNLEVLEHLLVCLVGEVGEFANLVKKVRRGDMPLAQVKGQLDEELIDCLIYLVKIANQFEVDLEAGFVSKLAANRVKFARYKK